MRAKPLVNVKALLKLGAGNVDTDSGARVPSDQRLTGKVSSGDPLGNAGRAHTNESGEL